MRPAMVHWWKHRHGSHRGAYAGCGHSVRSESPEAPYGGYDEWQAAPFGGGSFGVRRPLRFLAYRLGLDETQVAELAKVLDELKTERAQAAVDDRRTLTAFADAVAGERFDEARAREARDGRVKSSERLQAAVERALAAIHALLEPEQRERLASMLTSAGRAW